LVVELELAAVADELLCCCAADGDDDTGVETTSDSCASAPGFWFI
jgi:hypothetical protein